MGQKNPGRLGLTGVGVALLAAILFAAVGEYARAKAVDECRIHAQTTHNPFGDWDRYRRVVTAEFERCLIERHRWSGTEAEAAQRSVFEYLDSLRIADPVDSLPIC